MQLLLSLMTRKDERIRVGTAYDGYLLDDFGRLLAFPGGELQAIGEQLGINVAALQEVADVPSRRVWQSVEMLEGVVTKLVRAMDGVTIEVEPFFLGPGEAVEALKVGFPALLAALKIAREKGATEVALDGFLG